MRRIVLTALMAVFLSACASAAPRRHVPTLMVKFVAPHQYSFEGETYVFQELAARIQAEYGGDDVQGMDMDMTGWTGDMDIVEACALEMRTGIPMHAHYTRDGKTSNISCK